MSKIKSVKLYYVRWKETHIYSYSSWVKASSPKEAKRRVNSHEEDERRVAEFHSVKSVGRKQVEEQDLKDYLR
jgi:hypothetical protein